MVKRNVILSVKFKSADGVSMRYKIKWIVFSLFLFCHFAIADNTVAVTRTISVDRIEGFKQYPPKVKALINYALKLAGSNLYYLYGSANPAKGGMDYSGTIYYLLKSFGLKSPRQANHMYTWVKHKGRLRLLLNAKKQYFIRYARPGDLLFWSGTYSVSRVPPITHVMMYLGLNKQKQILVFGASNGRYFKKVRINGVSVFTLKLKTKNSSARLVAFGCIPGLTCE